MSPLLTTFAGASVFNYGFETSASASDYELIATTLGTGSSTTITFSSIPSIYRHLQVRYFIGEASTGANLILQFNGSSSTYYAHYAIQNNALQTGTQTATTSGYFASSIQGSGTSSIPQAGWFDVLDYANTNKNKTWKGLSLRLTGTASTNEVGTYSGAWYSTAAITSLSIVGGSNLTTTTRVSLYGLKG